MIEKKLYTGGGASFSLVQRKGAVESDYVRIVADDGYAITNGEEVTKVIDVPKSDTPNWSDCALPPTPPDPDPEIDDSEVAEILLGGES